MAVAIQQLSAEIQPKKGKRSRATVTVVFKFLLMGEVVQALLKLNYTAHRLSVGPTKLTPNLKKKNVS